MPSQESEGATFACPEEGCIKVYRTYNSLQQHLDVGKHLVKPEQESAYDVIKRKWVETCESVGAKYIQKEPSTSSASTQEASEKTPIIEIGWALINKQPQYLNCELTRMDKCPCQRGTE